MTTFLLTIALLAADPVTVTYRGDEQLAVLETEAGELVRLPKTLLPAGVAPGAKMHLNLTVASDVEAPLLTSYSMAYYLAEKEKKPLLVFVTGPGCEPCQRMKKDVIPTLRKSRIVRRTVFVEIDPSDTNYSSIAGSGAIPQIHLWTPKGHWVARGFQPVEAVEKLIDEKVEAKK